MTELINTRHIRSELLYEVTVDQAIQKPTFSEIVAFLDGIDVITEDGDVFVLNEMQYENFRDFVETAAREG